MKRNTASRPAARPKEICPFCGRINTVDLYFKNSRQVVHCRDCDLGFVAPLPSREELQNYYGESFFVDGAAKFGYPDYLAAEDLNRRNFEKLKWAVERHVQGGRLLDVGCATGGFLTYLDGNWQAYGVEISRYAWGVARARLGETVFNGDLLEVPLEEGSFDAVTLWDTLDHLPAPLAILDRVRALLKPGGVMACTVGDLSSWVARIMGSRWYLLIPPTHLYYYTRTGLTRILEGRGFEVVEVSYLGKWVSLQLAFFRLAYVIPGRIPAALCRWLSRRAIFNVPAYFKFGDVMLVFARKR